jgi:hypothetical protein
MVEHKSTWNRFVQQYPSLLRKNGALRASHKQRVKGPQPRMGVLHVQGGHSQLTKKGSRIMLREARTPEYQSLVSGS